MEGINKTNDKYVFKAEIEDSLINSIRRYIGQIQTAAITEVEIVKNDSPLYDETLAHRLGLVPLKQSSKKEGKLKLNIREKGTVYSGSLEGDFEIVYGKIPLTILDSGQEIELVASVGLGKGQDHAKFTPGMLNYREVNEIITDKEIVEKIKGVFSNVDVKQRGEKYAILDDKEREITDICEGVAERLGKKAEVKQTKEKVVTVETFGHLSPKDIFLKSSEALRKDLAEVSKKIGK